MTLELDHVGIGDEPGAALPVVSAVAAPGRPGSSPSRPSRRRCSRP